MNIVNQILVAVFVAIGLGGCATPFRAPPDVAHIKLERKGSPVVIVEKIWLERTRGTLVLKGYVVGRPSVTDTTQTHLDVTLYDESNRVLRTSVAEFSPRQIPGLRPPQIPSRRIRQSYAHYCVVLDPLPSSTARIEVRAYESPHSATGSPASDGSPVDGNQRIRFVETAADWKVAVGPCVHRLLLTVNTTTATVDFVQDCARAALWRRL